MPGTVLGSVNIMERKINRHVHGTHSLVRMMDVNWKFIQIPLNCHLLNYKYMLLWKHLVEELGFNRRVKEDFTEKFWKLKVSSYHSKLTQTLRIVLEIYIYIYIYIYIWNSFNSSVSLSTSTSSPMVYYFLWWVLCMSPILYSKHPAVRKE